MLRSTITLSCLALLTAILAPASQAQQQQPNANYSKTQRSMENEACDPVPFTSKNGDKKGWKVVFPGKRPLATPAVVDGLVFLGGGFGSHEFYAFDAATGQKKWVYRTKDDGPTAAAVSEGYVAFNTESCELEVLTVKGKSVWKKWLGDPLMSMPAIADGKVYMAYPNSKGDRKHYLACFELKSEDGRELWKHEIAGEVITAPVIVKDQVYLATLEGTLYCFKSDGKLVWQEKKNATSAPTVDGDECYFSCRTATQTKGPKPMTQQEEALARRGGQAKDTIKEIIVTRRLADYLDSNKRMNSHVENLYQSLDTQAGFNEQNKGDSKIKQAMDNLGQTSVAGVWSYQGSRPVAVGDRLYSAMGDSLKCVDLKTEKEIWSIHFREKKDKGELLDAVLTPPAVVNGKIFLGTASGEVLCLSANSGKKLWSANVGEAIVFQLAVAKGRVYVATATGSLICLETGDDKDDGWQMWGANAGHNGASKAISAK